MVSIMKVGDLVKQKYPVHRPIMGIVIEVCGKDVLVNWPDYNGHGRGRWHRKGHLWRVS